MDSNASNDASEGLSRRGLLLGSALMGAGATALAARTAIAAAAAAVSRPDPLVPIPLPPQVPAAEALAVMPDTRLWFWDTGGRGQPIVLLHPATGSLSTSAPYPQGTLVRAWGDVYTGQREYGGNGDIVTNATFGIGTLPVTNNAILAPVISGKLNIGNGYALHGTLVKDQLGRPASHGCVRVGDADMEKLFHIILVGKAAGKIVENDYVVTEVQAPARHMAADETCAASHQRPGPISC